MTDPPTSATLARGKWVAALRSGGYEQGRAMLRSIDDKYCCMGVLCDVVDPEGWQMNEVTERWVHGTPTSAFYPTIGVWSAVGVWDVTSVSDALSRMNDEDRMSFEQIADWIEENL